MREVKRIINVKFLLLVVILFGINGFLLINDNAGFKNKFVIYEELIAKTIQNKNVQTSYYDAALNVWKQFSQENEINGGNITDDIKAARQLLIEKAKYADGYHIMVNQKMENAQKLLRMDMYKRNSYERINLSKTLSDLTKYQNMNVSLSNGVWLEKLYEYKYIQIFVLLILCFTVYGFFAERKTGLYYLIHAGKAGRGKFIYKTFFTACG